MIEQTYNSKADKETMKISELRTHYKDLILDKIQRDVWPSFFSNSKIDYNKLAIHKIEQEGIVFIDEIDKIASPEVK